MKWEDCVYSAVVLC